MKLSPNHQEALGLLNKFVENGLESYSSKRNYDFGIGKRGNVSNLSPYIKRRILHEKEVIHYCLEKFKYSKIEKFIQRFFGEHIGKDG